MLVRLGWEVGIVEIVGGYLSHDRAVLRLESSVCIVDVRRGWRV